MPTPAENEALEMMQRLRLLYSRGEPMTAKRAADIILELADRIRMERRPARPKRTKTAEPSPELTKALDALMNCHPR